jgi:hypothetical protein
VVVSDENGSQCPFHVFIHGLGFSEGTTVQKGHTVAQLFEALRYKQEGRGFDSRLCNRNFSLT